MAQVNKNQTKTNTAAQAPAKGDLPTEQNGIKVSAAQAKKMGDMNTSERIRYMNGEGYSRSDTAKYLDKRYQHVRNVLITPLKGGTSTPAPTKGTEEQVADAK